MHQKNYDEFLETFVDLSKGVLPFLRIAQKLFGGELISYINTLFRLQDNKSGQQLHTVQIRVKKYYESVDFDFYIIENKFKALSDIWQKNPYASSFAAAFGDKEQVHSGILSVLNYMIANAGVISGCIRQFFNMEITNEGVQNFFSEYNSIRFAMPEIASKHLPILIMMVEYSMMRRNWRKLPEVDEIIYAQCRRKIIDIHAPGLLIHNTRMNWSKFDIVRFVERGLQPSGSASTVNNRMFSHFEGMLSFFMQTSDTNEDFYQSGIAFIIDSDYCKKNHSHFFYHDKSIQKYVDDNKWDYTATSTPEYYARCESLGFIKKNIIKGWNNEVQTDLPIPFDKIIGVVVEGHIAQETMIYLLRKLGTKYPELVFPVYDKEGNLLWPKVN